MLYRLPCGGRGLVQWHASLERSNGSTTPKDLASSHGRADRTSSFTSARSVEAVSSLFPRETRSNSKSCKVRKDRRLQTSPRLVDVSQNSKAPPAAGLFCISRHH